MKAGRAGADRSAFAIVKLGGSVARGGHLRRWLAAIAALDEPVAIVPGGGVFADAVRDAQADIGFDDGLAHRLALAAMTQFGIMLCALQPRFLPAPTETAFAEALAARRIPVWSPETMAAKSPEIEESWDMTSDSLAAWLAGRLGARRLILVKSVAPAATQSAARKMAKQGVVDRLFPRYLERSGAEALWLGPQDWPCLVDAVRGRAAGARIVAG